MMGLPRRETPQSAQKLELLEDIPRSHTVCGRDALGAVPVGRVRSAALATYTEEWFRKPKFQALVFLYFFQ